MKITQYLFKLFRTWHSLNASSAILFGFVFMLSFGAMSCHSSHASKNETCKEVQKLKHSSKTLQSTNPDSAIIMQKRALKLARSIRDKPLEASVLALMATSYSINMNLDKSDSCNWEALRHLAQPNSSHEAANIYCNLGINQSKRSNLDSALILYKRANEIATNTDSPEEIQNRTFNNIGITYQLNGQYDSSMVYLQKALILSEKRNDTEQEGNVYLNMGNCCFYMKNVHQADAFYQKADSCYSAVNSTTRLMQIKNNHTSILSALKQYDKALETSLEAERLAKKTGSLSMLGSIYNNRGQIYFDQKKYNKCIELQNKSYAIKKQFHDTLGFIHYHQSTSAIYLMMNHFEKAKQHALKGLELAKQKGTLHQTMELYGNLADIYGEEGNYKVAAEYLSKKSQLKDSIFTKERYRVVQELQAKYEAEKKDNMLQTATLNLKVQKQRTRWLLAISTFSIISISFIYYIRRKNEQNSIVLARQGDKVAQLTNQTLMPKCGNDLQHENSNSALTEEKINELLRGLLHCMEEKKMFKNPSLNLDILAETMDTNRTYLSIVINSRIRKGFAEYVNFYRVEEAKRLLRDSNEKIASIYQMSGFGSAQTFYATFKQFEQLTPAKYRKVMKS